MAAHYGMAVIPARAYKPRDKAKAESGVLLAERWIIARLRDRKFFSVSEANAAIAGCVTEINARPFQKMEGRRQALFESLERPALRPLPADRYEFATWRKARVNIDYHVEADRHYYSVPHHLAGQKVDVRLSAATVEIFHSSRRVASHPRSFERHRHSTDTAHMPESHPRHPDWTPPRIIDCPATTAPPPAGPRGRATRGRGPRRPAPCPWGPTPPAASSRSSSPPWPASRCPAPALHRPPTPATTTSAAPATTAETEHTMLLNTTIEGLRTLRLDAMAAALAEQHEQAAYAGLGFDERLGLLVDRELTERSSRRLERCLKTAPLRTPPTA